MSRLLLIRYLKHWRSLHCRQCFLSSSHQRNSYKLLHTQIPEAASLRNNKEPSRKVKLRSSWRYDVGFLNTDFGEHFQNCEYHEVLPNVKQVLKREKHSWPYISCPLWHLPHLPCELQAARPQITAETELCSILDMHYSHSMLPICSLH